MPLRKLGGEMTIRNMPKNREEETKRPSNAKKNNMNLIKKTRSIDARPTMQSSQDKQRLGRFERT